MLKESNILKSIRLWCGQNNILCFRCNVGKFKTDNGWIDTGLPNGWSDLVLLLPKGRFVFVECKNATGKLREDQVRFANAVTALGFEYLVARDVSDVQNFLAQNPNRAI